MLFSIIADIIATYWIFLSIALLIGIATGWFAADREHVRSVAEEN